MARFESGEVSLTTSISKVRFQLVRAIMPRDAVTPQLKTEFDLRQTCQFGAPTKTQQIPRIEQTCDLQQDEVLALRLRDRYCGKDVVWDVERQAHATKLPHFNMRETNLSHACSKSVVL